jgi:hypothetical protein
MNCIFYITEVFVQMDPLLPFAYGLDVHQDIINGSYSEIRTDRCRSTPTLFAESNRSWVALFVQSLQILSM